MVEFIYHRDRVYLLSLPSSAVSGTRAPRAVTYYECACVSLYIGNLTIDTLGRLHTSDVKWYLIKIHDMKTLAFSVQTIFQGHGVAVSKVTQAGPNAFQITMLAPLEDKTALCLCNINDKSFKRKNSYVQLSRKRRECPFKQK